MDSKKTEVFKAKTTKSSGVGSIIHEELNDVSQSSNAKNLDKKKLITGTQFGSTIDATSAQDKQDATKGASIDDEDFSLRLESSDEDTFRDAIDDGGASTRNANDAKSAVSNKSETLFSDIESSDDSIVYEPKSKSIDLQEGGGGPGQSGEKKSSETTAESVVEETKVIESEFDLVESDEEFFEDLPLPEKPEKPEQLSQDKDKAFAEEEVDEEERNSTPLIDEESDKSTQLDVHVEELKAIELNLEQTESSIITSDQSMDLMLESSIDSTDPSNTENVMATTETKSSHDLADDQSTEVDDKESSIDQMMIADVMEDTNALPESSFLLERKVKCPTTKPDSLEIDMFTSESSNQTEEISCDKTIDSLQVSSSIPTTKEKSGKLIEDLATVDFESSESPKKLQEVPQDSGNIPMSPTTLEDATETMDTDVEPPDEGDFESCESSKEIAESHHHENISMSPTLVDDENISTNVVITEKLNLDGDEKMEENLLQHDDNESLTSENKKFVVEEPMQIDDTIFDVSEVSEMEAIESNTTIEKTEKETHLEEGNDEDINLKSDEHLEVNKEVTIDDANISDTPEELVDKPIKKSTETSEIDTKLSELERSPLKPTEPADTTTSQDLMEKQKAERLNKSNGKADDSTSLVEERPISVTKTDETLVTSSKLSTDAEIKEKVNLDDGAEKNNKEGDLLDTTDDVGKSQELQDETEQLSEITPKSLESIEKLPKTSDGISPECIEQTSEKSNEQVPELNEKVESPKKIQEKFEKSDASVTDADETIKSPQKSVEMSHESNNILNDSQEKLEPTEKSKKIDEHSQEQKLKPSEESSEHTKQQSDNNEESLIETLELVDESDGREGNSMETNEPLQKVETKSEESNKQEKATEESLQVKVDTTEKPSASETDSIEKQELVKETVLSQTETAISEERNSIEKQDLKETAASQGKNSVEKNELLTETAVTQNPDSIEKQDSLPEATDSIEKQKLIRETVASKETDSIRKEESLKETADSQLEAIKSSEVISSNTETVETPKVVTETFVENAVEVATSNESTNSKQIIDSETGQDTIKTPAKIDPEIIEIDDDDDLEEEKKLKDSSKKDEKASTSTSSDEKVPQDKKTDDATMVCQNKEAKQLVVPMDVDEEITTDKLAKKPPIENQATNQDAKTVQESAVVKDGNTTMKGIPVQVLDDDDEPLLMIDTSHKEDNDTESNFMDNETATSAPTTDSSSDGSLEVFYDKECVNYECKRASKNFYRATVFAMNFFKISKKRTKTQFVCEDCYDRALSSYEELCKTLKHKQPLLHGTTFKCQEFVEIIDSSDEDESDTGLDKGKVSDENALPKESIEMLEAELEGAIRKVMHSVDIQNQLSWTKQILQQRLTNLQDDSDFVTEQLRALQRKADHMHNSLYQCPKIKLRQLTPLDLNSGRMYNPESDNSTSIPLPGDIIRNPICVNEQYYAVKTKAIASWVPCKVIEEVEGYAAVYNNTKTYKIKFTKLAKYPMFKTVYAKHMAYYDPPNVRLPIGSRVIAYFDATSLSRGKEKMLIPSAFYPGIIAEPLKQSNKFRYLVFYDDGYFQYVNHKDVRLVCQASENVWEDVHHQSREFIHNYLTQYAVNRPMVQTQKGQSMLVDYNGKWIYARVIDVDCSLVQMLFEGQSRSEWIYRGSTRLGPVYKESNNLSQKNTLNATRRRTEPFIRYINGDDSSSSQQVQETEQPQAKAGSSEIRSVAKKSVSRVDNSNNNNTTATSSAAQQPVPTVRHLNNSTIFVDDDNKPKGKVVYYTARKNLPPRNYVPHICNPSCPFNITHNLSFYSPLAKPLLSGWERQVFRQKSKKFIIYRGPCGKRMRNIEELHRYLRVTDNELNVDNFDFSPDTNCLAEYVLEKCLVNKKDISCGKEKMPIPCVNYYDETMPPACEYSAVRIPTEGVPLNLDEEFLCGCDCEDDCSDKTKCACWQLTYAGAKYGMPTVPTEMVGYQYKRLYEHVPTGIYECNSRCKCKASCVNRVVQQPLQSKLQVFKTSNRGWGLRCINDVPRGSFICVYAGQMLTEQVANEGGLDAGDEYFAELDYIEVAEQIKEGYESDVQEPEEEEDLYNPEREDDDIDFRAPGESFKDKEFNTRLRARKGNKNSTDGEFDSQERQVISFEPNKNMDTSNEPNEKPTIRKLFGKDESCYVMDAKVRGNLGRYFNHSCSPNLFVQNVFVDTHDLRFPWVAFFASTHIRAGTELTWNYNYEVGVVPGKVLYCQCGAPNCRQRLL